MSAFVMLNYDRLEIRIMIETDLERTVARRFLGYLDRRQNQHFIVISPESGSTCHARHAKEAEWNFRWVELNSAFQFMFAYHANNRG